MWGITPCNQSNRNGFWSRDQSLRTEHFKNRDILVLDMLLDCDRGQLIFREVRNSGNGKNGRNNQYYDDNVLYGLSTYSPRIDANGKEHESIGVPTQWVPHFNLHSIGSEISVKKIHVSRFGKA